MNKQDVGLAVVVFLLSFSIGYGFNQLLWYKCDVISKALGVDTEYKLIGGCISKYRYKK